MVIQKQYEKTTEEFIGATAQNLQRYRVSEEIARLEAIGMEVRGVHYFEDLFQLGGEGAIEPRLASIFVGCTAKGMIETAEEARDHLLAINGHTEEMHEYLGTTLLRASREEHAFGGIAAAQRLRNASKELIHIQEMVVPAVIGQLAMARSLTAVAA
jgi:hypothetical protein